MTGYGANRLTVNTDAIIRNFRTVGRFVAGKTGIMAVIKANAYGHGIVNVAVALEKNGARMLAVNNVDEAVQLRDAGISASITVLGGSTEAGIRETVSINAAQAVYDENALHILQREAVRLNKTALAHLKIDTGMTRIGVKGDDALMRLLSVWKDCPNVEMSGMFTHFAAADTDAAFTETQNERFKRACAYVHSAGHRPFAHAAASAAIAFGDNLWYDMVRPGIALYGGTDCIKGLTPAQRLTSYPVRIAWAEDGDTIGYGRTYTAERPMRIMTVPIGYGDGYKRILGNRAQALVCGKRCNVVGRVCMDQLTLDVTHVPNASMGDEVVLLGRQGIECITPEEMAVWADTISYEVMLGFDSRRVKKVLM